jgi:hypothetical protein
MLKPFVLLIIIGILLLYIQDCLYAGAGTGIGTIVNQVYTQQEMIKAYKSTNDTYKHHGLQNNSVKLSITSLVDIVKLPSLIKKNTWFDILQYQLYTRYRYLVHRYSQRNIKIKIKFCRFPLQFYQCRYQRNVVFRLLLVFPGLQNCWICPNIHCSAL